jgi:hypothetical protein
LYVSRDEGESMVEEHDCTACSAGGCTAGKTEESTAQEIGSGAYLLAAAVVIVLVSLAVRWLL